MNEQIQELIKKYQHKEKASKANLEQSLTGWEEGYERGKLYMCEEMLADLKNLIK